MRLTPAGALLAVACAIAVLVAWLLGVPELSVLAAGTATALATSVVRVARERPRLSVERSVRPPRLPLDGECRVRLQVTNAGRRSTPVLELTEAVPGPRDVELLVAPLAPAESCVAVYPVPTSRRGLHHIGPLGVTVRDAFGLARRDGSEPGRAAVIVLARVWPLTTLPAAPGDEPEHGTRAITSASTVDEEFASLRDYVEGDDIRRVHWPSTARRGAPVVRQFDVPWQRRTTVVLDRRAGHDDAAFERAVSAAASVVELAAARDELVRLVTTAGEDTGHVPASEHRDELLDRLAVVTVDPADRRRPDPLVGTLTALAEAGAGGVVVCSAAVTAAEAIGIDRAARGIGRLVLVRTVPPGIDGPPAGTVAQPDGATVIGWDGTTGLDTAWEAGLGADPTRGAAATGGVAS